MLAALLTTILVVFCGDNQSLAVGVDSLQEALEALGLDLVHFDGVDHNQVLFLCLCAQDGLHSQSLDLLVEGVAVVAGLGGQTRCRHDTTAERGWSPDGRGRCPSGATA